MRKYRWYVYELVDPRDGLPFYIGKGQGARMYEHEREARKQVCSEKTQRIKDILDSGREILCREVAYFRDEQMAYDFEAQLVKEIGLENLTNIIAGGGTARQRQMRAAKTKDSQPRSKRFYKLVADWIKAGGLEGPIEVIVWARYDLPGIHKMVRETAQVAFTKWLPAAYKEMMADDKQREELLWGLAENGVSLGRS